MAEEELLDEMGLGCPEFICTKSKTIRKYRNFDKTIEDPSKKQPQTPKPAPPADCPISRNELGFYS